MKAICIRQAGKLDSLTLMDIRAPEIDDNEVLVRVKAIGVGIQDRWFMPKIVKFPYVIGIEAAGIIEKVGKAVAHYHPGDSVMFTSGMQPKGGTWAEFAAFVQIQPHSAQTPRPKNLRGNFKFLSTKCYSHLRCRVRCPPNFAGVGPHPRPFFHRWGSAPRGHPISGRGMGATLAKLGGQCNNCLVTLL